MTFFARLVSWVVTWILVLALFGTYVWLLDILLGIDSDAMPSGSGRAAAYVIGALVASFATINGISAAVRWYRTRNDPKIEPVRGPKIELMPPPNAKVLRAQIVPTRADRIRKGAVLIIAGLFLLGVAVAVASTIWNTAR